MKDNLQQDSPSFSTEIIRQVIAAKIIAIIGNQGAGKTTLALKLAEIIGLDYVEPFILGKDNKMTEAEIQELKDRISLRDNWIIDGGFGLLGPIQSSCWIVHYSFVCGVPASAVLKIFWLGILVPSRYTSKYQQRLWNGCAFLQMFINTPQNLEKLMWQNLRF
jgi:energy-coupling factor transporter ATP-binding protein EcfA2